MDASPALATAEDVPPPPVPTTLDATGLAADHVEQLLVKTLYGGEATGLALADRLRLPYTVLEPLVERIRAERLVEVRGTAGSGSAAYRYALTDLGRDLAVLGMINATGAITPNSDRNVKDSFGTVDTSQILRKVIDLPITTWKFKAEDDSIRHLGPMAQDFMAAFGLGGTERGISTTDLDGVSLAAIQGLNAKLEEKDALIAALALRIAALERAMQD